MTLLFLYVNLQVLAKLERFKKALSGESQKTTPTSGESGDGNDEDLSDWKGVHLKFAPDRGKVSFLVHFHSISKGW